MVLGLVLLFLLVSIGLVLANAGTSVGRDLIIGVLLLLSGIVVARYLASPHNLVTALRGVFLGPWLGVGFAVGFGLGTLRRVAEPDSQVAVLDPSYLVPAALISLVGLLSASAVYLAVGDSLSRSFATPFERLRGTAPAGVTSAAVWVLVALGVVGYLASLRLGFFGYTGNAAAALDQTSSLPYLSSLLSEFALFGMILAGWRWSRERTLASLLQLLVVLAILQAFALLLGMKERPIEVLAAAAVGVLANPRAGVGWWVALLILAFLVVTPFVNEFRNLANGGSGGRTSLSQLLPLLEPDRIVEIVGGTSPRETADQLVDRSSRVSEVAVIVQRTPDVIPYASVTEIAAAPVLGLIPRSLWADKPVMADGYTLKASYYGSEGTLSNVGVPPYADLYRHGGIAVVILGMGVFGLLLRVVDARGAPSEHDPRVLFLPFLLLTYVFKQENPFTSLLAGLVGAVFVAVAGARLTSFFSRSTAPEFAASSPSGDRRFS